MMNAWPSGPSTDEESNHVSTSTEQDWVGRESTPHGIYLSVDTNAPIEPPEKAPTVPVSDRNAPADLL
jgi:hypothetical protein